jgi:hypothetical protein
LEEEHFVPEPRVKENGDARSDETIIHPSFAAWQWEGYANIRPVLLCNHPADRGEYRQAAGAFAEAVASHKRWAPRMAPAPRCQFGVLLAVVVALGVVFLPVSIPMVLMDTAFVRFDMACAPCASKPPIESRLRHTKWGSGSVCTAAILGHPCPFWVKSGHRNGSGECPLCPQ